MAEPVIHDERFWDAVFAPLLDRLASGGGRRVTMGGLGGAALPMAIAAAHRLAGPTMVVVPGTREAEAIRDDLTALLPDPVLFFPSYETLPFHGEEAHQGVIADRVECMAGLLRGDSSTLVVASAAALVKRLPPPSDFPFLSLREGMRLCPSDLGEWLLAGGYRRETGVFEQGRWSRRGGVVDVGSYGLPSPVRIEFSDDQIESLRLFDPQSQRSVRSVREVILIPARELFLTPEHWNRAIDTLPDGHPLEDQLSDSCDFPGIEHFVPLFNCRSGTLLDYLPSIGTLVLLEPDRLESAVESTLESRLSSFPSDMPFSAPDLYASWEELDHGMQRAGQVLVHLPFPGGECDFSMPTAPVAGFADHAGEMTRQFRCWLAEGYRIIIACDTRAETETIRELLPVEVVEWVSIEVASLSQGFIAPETPVGPLVFLVERGLLSRRRRPDRIRKFRGGQVVSDWDEFAPGCYVVHEAHGIGRFLGIKRIDTNDGSWDCLEIQYDGGDKLLVPLHELGQVKKYLSPSGAAPSLDRIGSLVWQGRLGRAKKRAGEIAGRLAMLYAERKARSRPAFPPPGRHMQALVESFPYEETPDQARAIASVLGDFDLPAPMDRLVCGDVGFGKTEVAVRAAFRAAEAGRQVAVLVPTTILAEQHYNTFRDRTAEFPVTVCLLSRFQTPAEQRVILRGLAEGRVNIVVGTHRLLQKDVRFNDLGLLIVDEEHRFGVAQKEYLREVRSSVDTISMTATPIPRTLHMSLSGFRSISLITTPPRDRYPIQTEIIPWETAIIRRAVERELERDGQVFFVHNRVQSLEKVRERLESIVDADIIVGHGQMPPARLEEVMHSFIEGRYRILLCTSIIESGLDLPRVNTIFIDNAHAFGLAELYQLRGRVGRSHHQAYCYLLTPGGRTKLKQESRGRLEAVQRYTQLGSGWHVAMRDLEIRGGGELLGAGQHGHIDAVGYGLFEELLSREVEELKGEKTPVSRSVRVEVPGRAYIPEEYMPDTSERVNLYRWVWRAVSESTIDDWLTYIKDRFGEIPEPVAGVARRSRFHLLARESGLEEVVASSGVVRLVFASGEGPRREKAQALAGRGWVASDESTGRLVLHRRTSGAFDEEEKETLSSVLRIFKDYKAARSKSGEDGALE
ncbi:MAG: transcription-repair coupling factor [Candidatus Fermentibacteraceae bacterium]